MRRFCLTLLLLTALLSGCAAVDGNASDAGGEAAAPGYEFALVTDAMLTELAGEDIPYGTSRTCGFDTLSGEEDALILGKLTALFGPPAYTTVDAENAYNYDLLATAPDGNRMYVSAYHGPGGPSIGGPKTPEGIAAAQALVAYVEQAQPNDCEYRGFYMDFDLRVVFGVKNGKPYIQEDPIEDPEVCERIRDILWGDASFEEAPLDEETFERIYREAYGTPSGYHTDR